MEEISECIRYEEPSKTKYILFLDSFLAFFYAKSMNLNSLPWHKVLFIWLEIIIAANILLLDIWVTKILLFPTPPTLSSQTKFQQIQLPTPSPQETIPGSTDKITPSPTIISVTPLSTQQALSQTAFPSVKEYFIPLGTGQTSATDWTSITGAQAYIDTSNYPSIKSAVFEASVSVPNANQSVGVRLFDITDKHPVWFSELDFSGEQPEFKTSQGIQLDSGNKLYQVQLKTQLGGVASLDSSRIHITLH